MDSIASISARFREALKQAELSRRDELSKIGDSTRSVWDVEGHEDSICSAYSVAEVQGFCTTLGIRPSELIGFKSPSGPLSNQELASCIREHCRTRNITLEQFETAAGWSVAKSLDAPEKFKHDYPIDGIVDICRELDVDWQRLVENY